MVWSCTFSHKMLSIPRPKIFLIGVVWVATCGGLVILWQHPLETSTNFEVADSDQQERSVDSHPPDEKGAQEGPPQSGPLSGFPSPALQIFDIKPMQYQLNVAPNWLRMKKTTTDSILKSVGIPTHKNIQKNDDDSRNKKVPENNERRVSGRMSQVEKNRRKSVSSHDRHKSAPGDVYDSDVATLDMVTSGEYPNKKKKKEMNGELKDKQKYVKHNYRYNDDYPNDEEYNAYDEDYDESDEYSEYTGGRYNVTPPDANLLVYNRIPKCASSTMQTILRRLSRQLEFDHVSSMIYNERFLTPEGQEDLVYTLSSSLRAAPRHALSYDRHLYYTNFSMFDVDPPVYINIVRDPVEKFISSFYYRRSDARLNRIQSSGQLKIPSSSWINRTVEECVDLNDAECSYQPGEEKEMILTFFCGHHDFCRKVGNKDALQAAKQVVAEEYSVVGLLEHMELSMQLMEVLIPRFMKGASRIYENIRKREHMIVNKNKQKPMVSAVVREKLHQRMADDLDFYNFLEQRLFEQKKTFLS